MPSVQQAQLSIQSPLKSVDLSLKINNVLDQHLRNWARWMSSGELSRLSVRGGHGLSGFRHYDTEADYDINDRCTALQVDAIIRDLAPLEIASLQVAYLGATWRGIACYEHTLNTAMLHVQIGINRRGLA